MSSPAAAASGGNGDAGQAQQGDAQQGNGDGPDVGALAQTLEGLSAGQQEMREFLMSQPWQPQAEGGGEEEQQQAEAPSFDLSAMQEAGFSDDEIGQFANSLAEQVQTEVARQVQQHVQPLRDDLDEGRRERDMENLVEEFPDMAQTEVAHQVVQQTHALVEANGWDPKLAADPKMWRVVYAAQQAFAAAQEEGADEGSTAAHLEGGAGASGARAAQQGDDFKQMLDEASKGGRQALPFP